MRTSTRTRDGQRTIRVDGIERERIEANPVYGVKRVYVEAPRERVLTEEELRVLWPLFDRLQPAVAAAWRLCATHGGRAPQVKKSAKERLAELIEPALEGLHTALKSGEIPSIVRAAQVVLDRTRFQPSQAIELYGQNGGPIEIRTETVDAEKLSPEQRATLLSIVRSARNSEQGGDER